MSPAWLSARKCFSTTVAPNATAAIDQLAAALDDSSEGVRIAAAYSLCQLGRSSVAIPVLEAEVTNSNLVAGMYAIRALERLGEGARPALATIREAQKSRYEFTRRIARRVTANLQK